jgi:hypothetical protein
VSVPFTRTITVVFTLNSSELSASITRASRGRVVRRDGVLEIEEDLAGVQPGRLGENRSLDPGTA